MCILLYALSELESDDNSLGHIFKHGMGKKYMQFKDNLGEILGRGGARKGESATKTGIVGYLATYANCQQTIKDQH